MKVCSRQKCGGHCRAGHLVLGEHAQPGVPRAGAAAEPTPEERRGGCLEVAGGGDEREHGQREDCLEDGLARETPEEEEAHGEADEGAEPDPAAREDGDEKRPRVGDDAEGAAPAPACRAGAGRDAEAERAPE